MKRIWSEYLYIVQEISDGSLHPLNRSSAPNHPHRHLYTFDKPTCKNVNNARFYILNCSSTQSTTPSLLEKDEQMRVGEWVAVLCKWFMNRDLILEVFILSIHHSWGTGNNRSEYIGGWSAFIQFYWLGVFFFGRRTSTTRKCQSRVSRGEKWDWLVQLTDWIRLLAN